METNSHEEKTLLTKGVNQGVVGILYRRFSEWIQLPDFSTVMRLRGEGKESKYNDYQLSIINSILYRTTSAVQAEHDLKELTNLLSSWGFNYTWSSFLIFIDTKAVASHDEQFTEISQITKELLGKRIKIKGILFNHTSITPKTKEVAVCTNCNKEVAAKYNACSVCNKKVWKETKTNDHIDLLLTEEETNIGRIKTTVLCRMQQENIDLATEIYNLILGGLYNIEGIVEFERKGDKSFYVINVIVIVRKEDGLFAFKPTGQLIERVKSMVILDKDKFREQLRYTLFDDDLEGLDLLMDAIILQMVSAPKHYTESQTLINRGNINILLVGSPGKGKSQLLKRAAQWFPKSRYVTGSGSSAIGMVASVSKDEKLGQYVLSPGALALCHPFGILCADELDKVPKEDLPKMNTQMDSLFIQVDKATIHQKIPCDVSILGALNPKYGSFEFKDAAYNQINLTKDFLDRFDLIFNVDHFSSPGDEQKVSKRALRLHTETKEDKGIYKLPREEVLTYFLLARQTQPKLCFGTRDHIQKEYLAMLKKRNFESEANFSRRMMDIIVRLAQAKARERLSIEIDSTDVKAAMEHLIESLKSTNSYSDSSGLNTFSVEEVLPKTQKDKIQILLTVMGKEGCGRDELVTRVNMNESDIDNLLQKMSNAGDIFSPKPGFYKRL